MMVISLTWDNALTCSNLEDLWQNSTFVPKQIGSAEKAWKHSHGYTTPWASLNVSCPTHTTPKLSVGRKWSKGDTYLYPLLRQGPLCRFSFLEATSVFYSLLHSGEIWQWNQLKVLRWTNTCPATINTVSVSQESWDCFLLTRLFYKAVKSVRL